MQTSNIIPNPYNPVPLSNEELLRLLKEEEVDSASYYASELAIDQANAMDRYYAKPYGDGSELPNRSSVVTHDIEDAINWIMPALMRTFANSDELLSIEDEKCDDDEQAKIAGQFLRHVIWSDNAGAKLIHDSIFDGLLQRTGLIHTYWEDPVPSAPEIIEGVTAEQLIRYVQDPEYVILAQSVTGDTADEEREESEYAEESEEIEAHAEAPAEGDESATPGQLKPMAQPKQDEQPDEPVEPTWTLKVQYVPKCGRARAQVIPPEEFRISRRARSIFEADYHCWKREVFIANVVGEFPDRAYELDPENFASVKADDVLTDTDPRVLARFPDEPTTGQRASHYDPQRRKVWENIEFIRIDQDGDGVVELRRIRRVGDTILENDRVEESEISIWSPIRVSHRAIGRSLADPLMDIQKIRTALTRRSLDSLSRSLAPRTLINAQAAAADPTLIDRLLDHDVGDVIPVSGDPNAVVRELQTPDVSGMAFQAIEYWDRRSEEASGVSKTRIMGGANANAITDTAKGLDDLRSAANERVEQVARWAADFFEEVFGKLLRLVIRHQDCPRIVKIGGKRLSVDPRRWSDEMAVRVHVGMVGESREKKLNYLNLIKGTQEQILLKMGQSPLVTFDHYRNTCAEMVSVMGFKDPSRFFGEIPEGWQPAPQADPKAEEAKAKLQLAQADMQQKGQIEQAKLKGQMQLQQMELQGKQQLASQDLGIQQQLAAAKAETDKQAAMIKAETERQIAEMRMRTEAAIAEQRLAAEMELARWKVSMELEHQARMQSTRDVNLPSDRPGGRLDA